jgi:signal transduction histidine kinase
MELDDIVRELRAAADELERRGARAGPVDPLGAAERAAIAEEVASVTRHDLRNKLASIRNATFYLRKRVEVTELWNNDAHVARFFGLVEEQIIGAMTLLDEGMTLQRLFARRVARLSGRECIMRALSCARATVVPELEIEGDAGEIDADLNETALGIRCLIENAAEAAGGHVKISAQAADGWLTIAVSDEGPGVLEANREAVFRPLHTTKEGHAGLGLGIARRSARRYSGDVTAVASPSGARFIVALPLASGAR